MAGIVVAVVGVAVLIVAIIALRNPKKTATTAGSVTGTITRTVSRSPSSTGAQPSRTSSSPSESSSTRTTAVGSQPLVVLNQGLLDGTAAAAAQRFRARGWTVRSIDEHYANDVVTTTAYFNPSVDGSFLAARALRRQFPTIHRVARRFSNLPDGPVVVVLTSDYSPN